MLCISYCTLFSSEQAEPLWSGLRPRHCHISTLIAFPVRVGRTHLKYSHTDTLCTCFCICVCVCGMKTQHVTSLSEEIMLTDGTDREIGETLRFHSTRR